LVLVALRSKDHEGVMLLDVDVIEGEGEAVQGRDALQDRVFG
jgi:hypothetical protein